MPSQSHTDTRQRIVNSASALIHAHSYAEVGVARICTDAGVTKGSFYHFFPSKRELTLAVLESGYAGLKRDLIDQALAADVPPMQRLRRFLARLVEFQATMYQQTGTVPGCQFGNLAAEQATQDELLRIKVADLLARLRAALREPLQQAVAQGEIGIIDIDATAAAMLAYLEGVLLMAKAQNDPEVLVRLLPTMLDIRIQEVDG